MKKLSEGGKNFENIHLETCNKYACVNITLRTSPKRQHRFPRGSEVEATYCIIVV